MAEPVALKKSLGELGPRAGCRRRYGIRSEILSGAGRRRPRSASDDCRFGGALGPASSRLGTARRASAGAQGWDSPRFLAAAVGAGSHHRCSLEASVGRVSATDVHDGRSRCGGRESGEGRARVAASGTAVARERPALAQRNGLRTAAAAAPARAHRGFRSQPVGHVLRPGPRVGRISPADRALGSAGIDDGSGDGDDSGARPGEVPGSPPRILADHGPPFIARDFKEFIRISGRTHVRTSPYYPPSNGKIERGHQSLKGECLRPLTPLTLEDARRLLQSSVDRDHTVRLHRAIG
jgi:transposase InsO family protein